MKGKENQNATKASTCARHGWLPSASGSPPPCLALSQKHCTESLIQGRNVISNTEVMLPQNKDIKTQLNIYENPYIEIFCLIVKNLPMVGTVDKTSPMCSLYNIVVLPAASNPSMTT